MGFFLQPLKGIWLPWIYLIIEPEIPSKGPARMSEVSWEFSLFLELEPNTRLRLPVITWPCFLESSHLLPASHRKRVNVYKLIKVLNICTSYLIKSIKKVKEYRTGAKLLIDTWRHGKILAKNPVIFLNMILSDWLARASSSLCRQTFIGWYWGLSSGSTKTNFKNGSRISTEIPWILWKIIPKWCKFKKKRPMGYISHQNT